MPPPKIKKQTKDRSEYLEWLATHEGLDDSMLDPRQIPEGCSQHYWGGKWIINRNTGRKSGMLSTARLLDNGGWVV